AAHDVDLIYCVPGESYLGLTDALTEFPQIRLVVCRHEGGAGFMAAADGRMREGRAGVALVSRGPGVTNAMIALPTAYHDATPLVMLIGHVERKDVGRLALQEQNYSRLLSDVTKGVFEVIQPIQASEVIARAFHLAQSGTPGPVAVILPEDIFDEPAEGPVVAPRLLPKPGPRAEDLDRLAEMLAAAERPLVL
ncbi:MAG: thiamine pyrophosphate-binding protein, partial [Bryobacteraceae bacterium]